VQLTIELRHLDQPGLGLLHGPERFEQAFDRDRITHLLVRTPATLAVILRLMHGNDQNEAIGMMLTSVSESILRIGNGSLVESLPLSALRDMRWFADRAPDDQVRELFQKWIRESDQAPI
jgi:hypothetical protein